ncbi:MAG: hypothetical protein JWM16_5113 [Verrucomicrobiales bacterium]|nr:hypothetical protein [Verrucomicrobiales bacterium]
MNQETLDIGHATKGIKPGKRLALFFDGTWNIPGSNTNVWRLSLMLADTGPDGVRQEKFYDAGVGTHWWDKVTGGAFGAGLSDNVRSGYRWLMEHYDPGDEIFIFGFSRGAFTARSLAGVISRCGLLKPDAPMSFMQLYERYMQGDLVRPIYRLKYLQKKGERDFNFEEKVLLEHAHYGRNFIKMVGVWDTVGSLGIPLGNVPGVSRHTLRFHNTHLSTTVQNSFQALALDEYRKPYWAVLWTSFEPDQPDDAPVSDVDNRMVEQRWFSGAHANVGGGYRDDLIPQRPLAWLQGKAKACGLGFRAEVSVPDEADLKTPTRDSYAEFLRGMWKILTFGRPYVRWVMSDLVRKVPHWKGTRQIKAGVVRTVNERIDVSVIRRCQLDNHYRPLGLQDWAKRKKLNLENVIAHPEQYASLWAPVVQPGIEI